MGASGWIYFTPYQSDPANALAELRQQIYASGDFINYLAQSQAHLEKVVQNGSAEQQAWLSDWQQREYLFGRTPPDPAELLQEVGQQLKEQTLDTIRLFDEGNGTHSILDIEYIAVEERTLYGASALPPDALLEIFGTPQPTHEQIEACYEHYPSPLDALYERWTAIYMIVYHDREPSEYCFIGASGD
jgi:hypothetical protein